LVFDCPGQIELYSHLGSFRSFVDYLQSRDWKVCVVYCLDSQFVTHATKYIAGVLQTLSAMVLLELPHVSVLTKMDICPDQAAVARLRVPDAHALGCELDEAMPKRFHQLNNELARVIDEWSMVSFLELDVTDEDSMAAVLGHIDMAVQFGEDAEVKVRDFDPGD
jgi:50S ribosomal subunit-associated GTPase HflX